MTTHSFDAITASELREAGSMKWSAYPDTIGAWVAEMDFGTAPAITQALHDAVERAAFGYLPQAWVTEMAESYTRFAADYYHWNVDPGRVRPVSDVLTALEVVITHYSRPGSPIILPTPAYMPFLKLPGTLGRDIIQVPMAVTNTPEGPHYTYDLDALDAAFTAGGHLMVLCNPHNPIGRVLTVKEMQDVAQVVDRHGGRVFSDEIHAPLIFPGHQHVPYASISDTAARHTVTGTSASKAWNLPGLKCAQLVLSNDEDAAVWSNVGHHAEMQASTLGVLAAPAAYNDSREWLADTLDYINGNYHALRKGLEEQIPNITLTPLEGTYLAWLDCRNLDLGGISPGVFFRDNAGVTMNDGIHCGEAGKGFIRLNLGMPRPLLAEVINKMTTAIA